METQRFREATVRDALAAVRRELGPDALVLSTRLVPRRGWRRFTRAREVEVMVAAPTTVSESRPIPPAGAPGTAAPAADVVARLVAAGIDRALAADVAASLPRRARRAPSQAALRAALAGRLESFAAGGDQQAPVEVFVGPPGAGKTTTIAKLAAQARVRQGSRIGLVAADGYRVGAVEQLRLYADILAAPFAVARTPADLEQALHACAGPVLVDTAGRSPKDRSIRDLFDALAGRPGVRTHLVIAASTTPRDAARIIDQYAPARPDRAVITKVDETDSIAPVARVLREQRLAVSYLGVGQRVPEDLSAATPAALAGLMLGDARALPEETA